MNPIPFRNAGVVAPDDEDALPVVTRALYVGGAGDLTVTMSGGMDVLFDSVAAGTLLHIEVTHVLDTGTDATNIVWLV